MTVAELAWNSVRQKEPHVKYFGYLFKPIIWILKLGPKIWMWQLRFIFSPFISSESNDGRNSRSFNKAIESDTGWGQDLKFTLRNGFLESYNAGSQFRIDSGGGVHEMGMVGKRVGRVDSEGLWRTEANEVIARFDDDGVLREQSNGIMSGVFESQNGTGRELGRLG